MNLLERILPTSASRRTLVAARARRDAVKASAAVRSMIVSPGRPRWTPRDYEPLAREGYEQQSVVYACVGQVAINAAEVPIMLQEIDKSREKTFHNDHPVLELLASPNPTMDDYTFRTTWGGHLLIAGNSYTHGPTAGELSNRAGEPIELWPLRPDKVRIVEGSWDDPAGPVGGYTYTEGERIDLAPQEVMHTRLFHPTNFWYGLSPLEAAARSVDQRNAAGAWNASLLQNDAAPRAILNLKGTVAPEAKKRFEEGFKAHMSGPANARKTLITTASDGIDYMRMALSSLEMDWKEGMNLSALDICMCYKVPPQILGIPGSQTYANYEQARKALYAEAVIPLLTLFCKHLTRWLLPKYGLDVATEYSPGYRIWYDRTQVDALQEDQEQLAKRVVMLFEKNVITQRQAVHMLGASDDFADDVYFYELRGPARTVAETDAKQSAALMGRNEQIKTRYPALRDAHGYVDAMDRLGDEFGLSPSQIKRILYG